MPVTPVPTGSGNGSSINLLGREVGPPKSLRRLSFGDLRILFPKDAKDMAMAALNAIKGELLWPASVPPSDAYSVKVIR